MNKNHENEHKFPKDLDPIHMSIIPPYNFDFNMNKSKKNMEVNKNRI